VSSDASPIGPAPTIAIVLPGCTLLESLDQQAHAIAAPPQNFKQVTPLAAEHKHMAGKRIMFEHRLNLRRQTIESGTHVRHARG
jgi:hypothetical protein